MNSSAKSNMFSVARETVLATFANHLYTASLPGESIPKGEAADTLLFCVVAQVRLGAEAIKALSNSAAALGYGQNACFFIALESNGETLAPKQLFSLIEGIDPLALVAADSAAMRALEQAYRIAQDVIFKGKENSSAKRFSLAPNMFTRILGRNAVTFSSFESMLSTPNDKQRAWALLKKLPRM